MALCPWFVKDLECKHTSIKREDPMKFIYFCFRVCPEMKKNKGNSDLTKRKKTTIIK